MIITIVLLVVVGTGAFFGGMKYQESKNPSVSGQFGSRAGMRTGGSNRAGFRPVTGEILSSDSKSITVKLQDGSSKIVLLSDKTTVSKSAEATVADLKVGEKVAAFGQENSDGSVTAQNVQLNPITRGTQGNGQTQIPAK